MAEPIRDVVKFTDPELVHLRGLFNAAANGEKPWHEAYSYVSSIIQSDSRVDANVKFWFEQAIEINRGDGAASRFIRSYTHTGLQISNPPEIPSIDMQGVSDAIARYVLEDVLSSGGVPDLAVMLKSDIRAAFHVAEIANLGGWGGSFYYWDIAVVDDSGQPLHGSDGHIISIGEQIQSDPASRNLLIQTLGTTLASFSSLDNLGELLDRDVVEAFEKVLELPAAIQDEAFGIARSKSDAFGGVWRLFLGSPPEEMPYNASWQMFPMLYRPSEQFDSQAGRRLALTAMANMLELYGQAVRKDLDEFKRIERFGDVGATLGSRFGALVGDNQLQDIAATSVLSAFGRNVEQVLRNGGATIQGQVLSHNVFDNFFADIGSNIVSGGVGAISSYLTAELIGELGLEGELGNLANSLGSSALSQIIVNLPALASGATSIAQVLSNVHPANIVGSYIGTKLAASLIDFDTVGGQIGASIGSSVGVVVGVTVGADGVMLGIKIGSVWGGPVGALVGAFVGYIVGGLIGSLFGGTPRSNVDIGWNEAKKEFAATTGWSRGGASQEGARSLATSAAQILNTVVAATASEVADAENIRVGAYGTYKKDLVYRATGGPGNGGVTFRTRDADELIRHGAAIGVFDLLPRLVGGDVFVKRAIAATLSMAGGNQASNGPGAAGEFDVTTLMGNIVTAQDYAKYFQNAAAINILLAAEPESVFSAGWMLTLTRALELGLDKRGSTDWTGGWSAFLDEIAGGMIDGIAFLPVNLVLRIDPTTGERRYGFIDNEGDSLGEMGDTIDTGSKDSIAGTAADDFITVTADRITNTSGLNINGAASAGSELVIRVAARIEGGDGNDKLIGGNLGNDLSGGNGADTLVGGVLNDWLFGGSGNDRLFAGEVDTQFNDGSPQYIATALDVLSNGDYLDGGDGDDVLYGARGSDYLKGGTGADSLYGGAGGDILEGGKGDDRGPSGQARLLGGGGTDQYVFSRGDGVDVIFDEADSTSTAGATGDSLHARLESIAAGLLTRNWAGGGDYEVDGSVKGGEDAIVFGPGIGFQDLIMRRSGTAAAPGQNLVIQLTTEDPVTHVRSLTGDEIIIQDWFESTRRVEWLRFTDGQEIRIGDISSFFIGSNADDVIIGTFGADFLYGGVGNDIMRGLAGDDFGFGGAGNDLVAGDEDNDFVAGGAGADEVIGGAGHDTVFGDDGADGVYGGAGSDIVVGGRGDDEVIGGAGNDIFRYERGNGRDILLDDLVDNWDLVWQSGAYVNGYSVDAQGIVSKNGQIYFDGSQWNGRFDYADGTATFRRHLGAVNGTLAANAGSDVLEFGVGIDIQDLMLRRTGADLQIAISNGSSDVRSFESFDDLLILKDWFSTGASIESFVFAATGRHDLASWSIAGLGTDEADTLTGTGGIDWITGNAGDDNVSGGAGSDILSGNGGGDTLVGGADNDVLYGGDGDDILEGGAGADQLIGGAGLDTVSYEGSASSSMRAFLNAPHTNTKEGAGDVFSGIEGLKGTSGADVLGGDSGANLLIGYNGNDTLYGGDGDDIYELNTSHGVDTIFDSPFSTEVILDSAGALNTDLFTSTWTDLGFGATAQGNRYRYRLVATSNATGEEVYRSRDNVDFIYTSAQSGAPPGSTWAYQNGQWLTGAGRTGNGVQTVREVFQTGDGGFDTLDLGANIGLSQLSFQRLNGGSDLQITYQGANSVTLRNQADGAHAIEALLLRDGLTADLTKLRLAGEASGNGEDFVAGDANANTLEGLGGDDIISGAGGADTLYGGDGDDVLEGGEGADTLDGGADSVTNGAPFTASEQTKLYGDTIRYVRSSSAVTIDLGAGTASGGHAAGDIIVRVGGIAAIENVVGSDTYNDVLRGDARDNRLSGLGGNDTLEGRAGNDILSGGVGDDTLRGGDGEDNLAGEEGNDTLEGGNNKDLLSGGAGDDDLYGEAGSDVLSGAAGDDNLYGGADNDTLGGDAGNDYVFGDAGDDQIAGGDGADTLYGGDGNDKLAGDGGNDRLEGGAGNDEYVLSAFTGTDVIVDSQGTNKISISGVAVENLWLTRSGSDLLIGVIGSSALITVQNYYASANASTVREVVLEGGTLFAAYAGPLIAAMTANSALPPAEMPVAIREMLTAYWHAGGVSAPVVADVIVATNEDSLLAGSVSATDHDNNIVSYTLAREPAHGGVSLNEVTGQWVYTPAANFHGQDRFEIQVTDALHFSATQLIVVDVASINDAPTDILLTGASAGIIERDHPPAGTVSTPIILGSLSATDVDAPDVGDFATHMFSVSDSRFEIVSGNVLQLKAGEAFDFEASTTVSVDVTVRDRGGAPQGLAYTRTFTFNVLDQDDYFYGSPGADAITGQAGKNFIYGYAGNDVLNGGGNNDTIDGGDGDDQIFGGVGGDTIYGGLGSDTVDGGDQADFIYGGDGNDTLNGQVGSDRLFGGAGDDLLIGGNSNDQLEGDAGNDRLEGGNGDDSLNGGDGDDLLIGGVGADTHRGRSGFDTVTYEASNAAVNVDLQTGVATGGHAAGDTFVDRPERLVGSTFGDTLKGTTDANVIEGGAGNDFIYGNAGNDTLIGGDGNDTIDGEGGDDTIDGGAGNDTLIGGNDSDTYLINANSGADTILNFDPNGDDIDVVGYQDITREQLWFERVGDDLVVSVIGTAVRTTVTNWYVTASADDRANYKIDFFIAGEHVTETIDAETLVEIMAPYTPPATQQEFDVIKSDPGFQEEWGNAWEDNAPPTVPEIAEQTINEDGTLTLSITVTDDFTPAAGLIVTAQAVRPEDHSIEDLTLVSMPTVSAANSAGERTLTVITQANASGQVAIKVSAVDAGGVARERVFLLNITPVADQPIVVLQPPQVPAPPLTKPTLDGGSWSVNVDASLVDQDGSETLEVRIANVPVGLSFNMGTNLGYGVWRFAPEELVGLRIVGPNTWSEDVALIITAISREAANGVTAASAAVPLNIVINARPVDIYADRPLVFSENLPAGTGLAWIGSIDGDAGDSATYALLNDAGGRFILDPNGLLKAGSTPLNYEIASSHSIRVRVTDSGGLTYEKDLQINVVDINEAPILPSHVLTVSEATSPGSYIGSLAASDPDIDPAYRALRYRLVGGATNLFHIDAGSGQMFLSGGLDYEAATSYQVLVETWDGGSIGAGLSSSAWATIQVANVNEAPILVNQSFTVAENTPGASQIVVGTVTSIDPDAAGGNSNLAFRAVGGDTNVFSVSANGQIRLIGEPAYGGRLWYEQRNSYSLQVEVWDGGAIGVGASALATMSMAVTNVDVTPRVTGVALIYNEPAQPEGFPEWFEWHLDLQITDPDDVPTSGALSYTIEALYAIQPGYTAVSVGSGSWNFYGPNGSVGSIYVPRPNEPIFWFSVGYKPPTVTMQIRVADKFSGEDSVVTARIVNVPQYPTMAAYLQPVVLDLDGNGVELGGAASHVSFDANADATPDLAGWISSGDAFLALDRNQDGQITTGAEISFVEDAPQATTDLEGLAAYDTNENGFFDDQDARFAEFLLWQDINQNGVSDQNELSTLTERQVRAINLTRSSTGLAASGGESVITGTTEFLRSDGATGLVGDVALVYGSGRIELEILDTVISSSAESDAETSTIRTADGRAPEANVMDTPLRPLGRPSSKTELARENLRNSLASTDIHARSIPVASGETAATAQPDEWFYNESGIQSQSALHASLDSVSRRRLQMIEAMASFSARDAADLELQPRRTIDPHTLQLLTSLPSIKVSMCG